MRRHLTVCADPKCPVLSKSPYCTRHQRERNVTHNERANQRYGSSTYKANRRKALERDGYRCKLCGTNKNLEVAHLVPKWAGGTDDLDNLLTTCSTHNKELDRRYREEHAS